MTNTADVLKFKKPVKKEKDVLDDPFRFITKEDLVEGIKNKKENEKRS